jgi:hypothetical protein
VPNSVHSSVIASIPSSAVVYVAVSSFVIPPPTIVVPETWSSVVAVPISWVTSLPPNQIITIPSSPSIAIV